MREHVTARVAIIKLNHTHPSTLRFRSRPRPPVKYLIVIYFFLAFAQSPHDICAQSGHQQIEHDPMMQSSSELFIRAFNKPTNGKPAGIAL